MVCGQPSDRGRLKNRTEQPACYAEQGLCSGQASVRLSVPSLDSSSGGFAAERTAGRRYRQTAGGAYQLQVRSAATAPPQHGAQQQTQAVPC